MNPVLHPRHEATGLTPSPTVERSKLNDVAGFSLSHIQLASFVFIKCDSSKTLNNVKGYIMHILTGTCSIWYSAHTTRRLHMLVSLYGRMHKWGEEGGVKLIQFGCEHKVTSRKRHVDHIRRLVSRLEHKMYCSFRVTLKRLNVGEFATSSRSFHTQTTQLSY